MLIVRISPHNACMKIEKFKKERKVSKNIVRFLRIALLLTTSSNTVYLIKTKIKMLLLSFFSPVFFFLLNFCISHTCIRGGSPSNSFSFIIFKNSFIKLW